MPPSVVNSHLNKSEFFLDDARLLLDNGRFDSCVSRAYYAMFRAAVALLSHLGSGRLAWNHGRLVNEINKRAVQKHQLLEPEEADWFRDAYELRCEADYRNRKITQTDAVGLVKMAEGFVSKIKEVVEDVAES